MVDLVFNFLYISRLYHYFNTALLLALFHLSYSLQSRSTLTRQYNCHTLSSTSRAITHRFNHHVFHLYFALQNLGDCSSTYYLRAILTHRISSTFTSFDDNTFVTLFEFRGKSSSHVLRKSIECFCWSLDQSITLFHHVNEISTEFSSSLCSMSNIIESSTNIRRTLLERPSQTTDFIECTSR